MTASPSSRSLLPLPGVTRADRLAAAVSRLLNPFVTGPSSFFTGIYLATQSLASAAAWTLFSLAVVVFPQSAYLLRQLRTQRISDLYVSLREERRPLYVLSQASLLTCFFLSRELAAPPVVLLGFGSASLANAASFMANRYTKVSAHAAASGMGNALVFTVSTTLGLLLLPVTLLVGWARLRTQAHTKAQVLAGWAIATSSVGLVSHLL